MRENHRFFAKKFETSKDDIVLALAEAAQNIVKHAYNGQPTNDKMKVDIIFENNQLTINLFDKGSPAIPQNIKPRKIDDIKAGPREAQHYEQKS